MYPAGARGYLRPGADAGAAPGNSGWWPSTPYSSCRRGRYVPCHFQLFDGLSFTRAFLFYLGPAGLPGMYFWYYITYIRGVIAIVPNPSLGYCASRPPSLPPSSSRRSRVSRRAGRGEDGCKLEGRATCRVSLSHCCASRRPRSTPTKHGHQPLASTRTTTHQLLPDSLPDSNRGEGADAARLAILSSYPPNGVLPGCGGPVGRAGCDPLARSEQRQDSGNCRGGGLVIPSSLLRPSAVCYVTVITALCPRLRESARRRCGAVRLRADFAQGLKCSELVLGAFVHLCTCHL